MTEQEWMDMYYRQYGPDHVPHYPDWPNMPHADWPRWGWRKWNDSEPAREVPWDYDCCNHGESDCICVTSADADLWNSYSSLSGLTAFNPADISAALSASDAIEDLSGFVSANSGIWASACYIPDLYENVDTLFSALNDKADASAVSAALSSYHVWTDSEKLAHEAGYYGDFSGTIIGIGTYERPLRVSKYVSEAVELIRAACKDKSDPLANMSDINKLQKDMSAFNNDLNNLVAGVSTNRELIEMLINRIHGGGSENLPWWINKRVSLEESKDAQNTFYYWDEKDYTHNP